MRKLTRAGAALAGAGLSLFGLGMGLGNVELLLFSAFPLLLLAASLAEGRPAAPTASRSLSSHTPRRGDAIDHTLRVDIPRGHDLLEVHAPLPGSFQLDEGTNLLLRTGSGRAVSLFSSTPLSRGDHTLPMVRAESLDATGLLAPERHTLAPAETVHVAPRLSRRSRFKGRLRTRGRLAAQAMEESRLGARSTDFRELRDYAWGDPPSSIHWKATARRLSARANRGTALVPIVSEYEYEGRRTVIVLLDGGPALRVGTNHTTGLDVAVEGSLALTSFFLADGSRVGALTYGARAGRPAYPESGEGQYTLLERALDPGAPDAAATLQRSFERMHGHFTGGTPFVIVVTRITPETAPELARAARRMRALIGERRRTLPFAVIDVRALSLAPTPTPAWRTARALVEHQDRRAAALVKSAGGRVVPWDPDREDILKAFLRRHTR